MEPITEKSNPHISSAADPASGNMSALSLNDRLAVLREKQTAYRQALSDMGSVLNLDINGLPAVSTLIPPVPLTPVPGVDGLYWNQLVTPSLSRDAHTRVIVAGETGVVTNSTRVPVGVTLTLAEGSLKWWQASFGYDEQGQKAYRYFAAAPTVEMIPNEEHEFVALTDFVALNRFTPALDVADSSSVDGAPV